MVLRSLLGAAIDCAFEDPDKVHRVRDEHGEEAQLVLLDQDSLDGMTLQGAAYALIKDNDRDGSTRPRAIVTVLPAESNAVRRMLCSQISRDASEETCSSTGRPTTTSRGLRRPLVSDPASLDVVVAEESQRIEDAGEHSGEAEVPAIPSVDLSSIPSGTGAILVLSSGAKQRVICFEEGFEVSEVMDAILRTVPELGPSLDVALFERKVLRLEIVDR